jgi:hypothetical protein
MFVVSWCFSVHVFTNAIRCAYVQAMCPMNVFDIEDLGDAGRKGAGKGSKSSKPSALAGERPAS